MISSRRCQSVASILSILRGLRSRARSAAAIDEGVHPVLLILRGETEAERLRFVRKAGFEAGFEAMPYAAFGLLDGTASLTGDAFRQRGNFRGKGIVGDDLVDEADAQGLCGIDHLAREEQQGSRAPAHQTGQALGTAESGRDAEADFGLAEAGLFGCDADVAGKGNILRSKKSAL